MITDDIKELVDQMDLADRLELISVIATTLKAESNSMIQEAIVQKSTKLFQLWDEVGRFATIISNNSDRSKKTLIEISHEY